MLYNSCDLNLKQSNRNDSQGNKTFPSLYCLQHFKLEKSFYVSNKALPIGGVATGLDPARGPLLPNSPNYRCMARVTGVMPPMQVNFSHYSLMCPFFHRQLTPSISLSTPTCILYYNNQVFMLISMHSNENMIKLGLCIILITIQHRLH